MRTCKNCGIEKNIEEYYKNKNVPSGRIFQCKACVVSRYKGYYLKNKEKIKLYISKHKAINRDRYNELSRIWAKNNPEKRALARKKWKAKNRELVNHYEKARQNRLSGATGSHSLKEWTCLIDKYNNCCFYCGMHKPLTKDHIVPISKGGSDNIDNIVPACVSCNSRKGNKHLVNRP